MPDGASLFSSRTKSACQIRRDRLQLLLAVRGPPGHQFHEIVPLGPDQRPELDLELRLPVFAPFQPGGYTVGQVSDVLAVVIHRWLLCVSQPLLLGHRPPSPILLLHRDVLPIQHRHRLPRPGEPGIAVARMPVAIRHRPTAPTPDPFRWRGPLLDPTLGLDQIPEAQNSSSETLALGLGRGVTRYWCGATSSVDLADVHAARRMNALASSTVMLTCCSFLLDQSWTNGRSSRRPHTTVETAWTSETSFSE